MKIQVILITGLYRFDNLYLIAKTLYKYVKTWNSVFDIHWVICKDQYNGYGDLSKFYEFVNTVNNSKTINLNWHMFDVGKPNQPNFGGDLFNDALENYVTSNNIDNPWVYILDDDNIVHSNLFPSIYVCCLQNMNYPENAKDIILLNIKFDEGHAKIISKYLHNTVNDRFNFIDGMSIADPSAVVMKYNIIKKYGMFACTSAYDFTWLLNLTTNESKENNIYYYHDDKIGLLISSYHNHLMPIINTEKIDKYKSLDIDNINIDINVSEILTKENIETDNYSHWYTNDAINPLDIPILTNESKQKILDIIYKEIENIQQKDEL